MKFVNNFIFELSEPQAYTEITGIHGNVASSLLIVSRFVH